jgi:hypothetical protein
MSASRQNPTTTCLAKVDSNQATLAHSEFDVMATILTGTNAAVWRATRSGGCHTTIAGNPNASCPMPMSSSASQA